MRSTKKIPQYAEGQQLDLALHRNWLALQTCKHIDNWNEMNRKDTADAEPAAGSCPAL
jgi:hypothetical protein